LESEFSATTACWISGKQLGPEKASTRELLQFFILVNARRMISDFESDRNDPEFNALLLSGISACLP